MIHHNRHFQCERATTPDAMDTVFRLRYECYHRRGAIPGNPERRFSDTFDQLPNHFSFLLRHEEEGALGTVRISVVDQQRGWDSAPSSKVFGDHQAFRDIARHSFVEASRLCFGQQARRDVLYRLLANMTAMADLHATRLLVACPRVEHSVIYQRLFGFRPVAPPRPYFGVSFETELLAVTLDEIRGIAKQHKSMAQAWSEATGRVAA
ncbi:MAG: GNAT family N-acetyltransferase [Bryobacterales bacterium]|nr:GNAT family N-acetyltransferase [Bryobacterales bacterium]